jgi:hypothetical protein
MTRYSFSIDSHDITQQRPAIDYRLILQNGPANRVCVDVCVFVQRTHVCACMCVVVFRQKSQTHLHTCGRSHDPLPHALARTRTPQTHTPHTKHTVPLSSHLFSLSHPYPLPPPALLTVLRDCSEGNTYTGGNNNSNLHRGAISGAERLRPRSRQTLRM